MKRIILDTNAYTALLNGDSRVHDALGMAETVYLPVIVLGELYAGFRGGSRFRENQGILQTFLARETVRVLPLSLQTAQQFGLLKEELRSAGTPLPLNDVWIGALVRETGAMLVSYDRHFRKIAGILLWDGMP